jgi:hypothetical protein
MACAVALTALPALFRHRAEGHYRQGPVVSAAPEADPLTAAVLGLAPLVGATAYDLRMRLAGPAPWVGTWGARAGGLSRPRQRPPATV